MKQRIQDELALIRQYFPSMEIMEKDDITWVKVPHYKLPTSGWNLQETAVAFNFPRGFPAASPYGIYFPSGLSYNQQLLNGGCQIIPPFEGIWNMISWTPADGAWKPESDVVKGSNMLNYLRSFTERFSEGI